MLGLIFFAFSAFGLGAFSPRVDVAGMNRTGLNLVVGYSLMVIFLVAVHVVAGVGLRTTVFAMVAVAAVGAARHVRSFSGGVGWRDLLFHPAPVLLMIGGASILANGGIGYIPTTDDEFSSWIGASRMMHFAGGFDVVSARLNHPDYTPGWRLLLLAPWQVRGAAVPGLSAAAPFIFHVALAALVFDLVEHAVRRNSGIGRAPAALAAWVVLLLFLAAEGTGRMWSLYLLIEPPQIYAYVGVFLLFALAEVHPGQRTPILGCAGIVMAGAYLVKAALTTLLPAAVLFLILAAYVEWRAGRFAIRDFAVRAVLLFGPALLVMFAWGAVRPSASCLASPLALLSAGPPAAVENRDAADLARRLIGAVTQYTVSYKSVVLLSAVTGLAAAVITRRFVLTVLAFLAFVAVYVGALYLVHLLCFTNAYWFENLVSIPRYSRVFIQTGHGLGVILLVLVVLALAADRFAGVVGRVATSRTAVLLAAAVSLVLAGWQVRQVYRSVADVTSRHLYSIDPRVPKMHAAVRVIEEMRGVRLPDRPRLVIINQGGTTEPAKYAAYFALGAAGASVDVHPMVSWHPNPTADWQLKTTERDMLDLLRRADVIWPLAGDDWMVSMLGKLGADAVCLQDVTNRVLVRQAGDVSGGVGCLPKPKVDGAFEIR